MALQPKTQLHRHLLFSCNKPTLHLKEGRFLISSCCINAVCLKCFQENFKAGGYQINLSNPTGCCKKQSRFTRFEIVDIHQIVQKTLFVWQFAQQLG